MARSKKRKKRSDYPDVFEETRKEVLQAFFQAAKNDDRAGIRHFLATGGQIDERDRAGRSVLMIYDLSAEMNLLLLSLKADVNAQDRSGTSVLAHQCIAPCIGFLSPDFDKIKVLLQAGASPELKDQKGRDLKAQVYSAVCSGLEACHAKALMEFIES